MLSKALNLLSLLPTQPVDFCDRVRAIAEVRWEATRRRPIEYRTVSADDGLHRLEGALGAELETCLNEPALAAIEARIADQQVRMPASAPFGRFHNGDSLLARTCYAVARALRPRFVVETGVCYGVTSAYLLAALEMNREGQLYSVDLPPLGKNGDDYVGWLIPNDLRSRWTLRRGTSRRILGPLLQELGPIDLFIHDSLHTKENMTKEFAAAWPDLRAGGVLISDDIQGNEAFLQFTRSVKPELSVVIEEKNKSALLGVAVKRK